MSAPAFIRALGADLSYDRGPEVLALQRQLAANGLHLIPDGVFGIRTADAVRTWQARKGLPTTGTCDVATWASLFPTSYPLSRDGLIRFVSRLLPPHRRYPGGCSWRLERRGIGIDGRAPAGSGGEPVTVRQIWASYADVVTYWSTALTVPAELIVATIATESGGKADAIRFEPGYRSDQETPDRVSPGLMQTLISTARDVLGLSEIDRAWLLQPTNAVRAGASYILLQSIETGFDPPVVACCYNAGGVRENCGVKNPWRMRQYPIGTSAHCDRFVRWFNDSVAVFKELPAPPAISFTAALRALAG